MNVIQRNDLSSQRRRRKQLRNESTAAELLLWCFLRRSQLEGRKFRRQHSYCLSKRLCIERVHDEMHTEFLNKHFNSMTRCPHFQDSE